MTERQPPDNVLLSTRDTTPGGLLCLSKKHGTMRDEDEIREQYEFLTEHLESEEMNHDGVEQMFTYYKRAIGWVLEEEHM